MGDPECQCEDWALERMGDLWCFGAGGQEEADGGMGEAEGESGRPA